MPVTTRVVSDRIQMQPRSEKGYNELETRYIEAAQVLQRGQERTSLLRPSASQNTRVEIEGKRNLLALQSGEKLFYSIKLLFQSFRRVGNKFACEILCARVSVQEG